MAHTKVAFQLAYPHNFGTYNAVIALAEEVKKQKRTSGSIVAFHLQLCAEHLDAFLKERQAGKYIDALDDDLNILEESLRNLVKDFNELKEQFQRNGVHVQDIEFTPIKKVDFMSELWVKKNPWPLISQVDDKTKQAIKEEIVCHPR